MKNTIVIILSISVIISMASIGNANNPFTAEPEEQQRTPGPLIENEFFSKIVFWQNQLRQKMSDLVRETRATGSPRPLMLLLGIAFIYGLVHSAGPGHGKAFAITYILTQQPRWFQGMLFGNFIALYHGISGIILVLILKILLQKSIMGSMADVSRITQLVSFGLITCLGVALLAYNLYERTQVPKDNKISLNKKIRLGNPFLSSLIVGIIPCPAVVMVMLFALSMDMIGLGILLGLTISLGMALTITSVVLMGLYGKGATLSFFSGKKRFSVILEHWITLIAALALAGLGGILFLAIL